MFYVSYILQATKWFGSSSISRGRRLSQLGVRYRQRPQKRHPGGGFMGLGTSPVSITLCRWREAFGSAMGAAESSAWA